MVTFILNNEEIVTAKASGSSLLDFIRYDKGLPGTKAGCREGDCGACTVLMGTLENGTVIYKSIVSCLTPLGNVQGRHIVTIEGISCDHLTPVQTAIVDNAATQCGFCTPGFVMSLTGESLTRRRSTDESVIRAVSGNICRCTGYKSIEKAALAISEALRDKDITDPVTWLVQQHFLPHYFLTIPQRLKEISITAAGGECPVRIAGGTDMMVQKADELAEKEIDTLVNDPDLRKVEVNNGVLSIGAAVTIDETGRSEQVSRFIPGIASYTDLIASEPVRNMATVGGNIVNASPIGDFTIILLAMDADVIIAGSDEPRKMRIKDLFTGYKKLRLAGNEYIRSIEIREPADLFSFEKVSKRTHLDIASVNTAISIRMDGDVITYCRLSAGGVSPVPALLEKTAALLTGRRVTVALLLEAAEKIKEEISPIDDVRGSAQYKSMLLRQLFLAHCLKLVPEIIKPEDII